MNAPATFPSFTVEQAEAVADWCKARMDRACQIPLAPHQTAQRRAHIHALADIRSAALGVMDGLEGADDMLADLMNDYGCDSIWWPLQNMKGEAA